MLEVALATRKQLNFIAVLARFVGANAVEVCRTRCGRDPQELTKREAGIIITHLQAIMPEYLREVLHSYHKALVIRREEENAEPITPKQIGFALSLAQSAQVDAHYLCRRLFGCAIERLSKKSAFGLIEYLKALASPEARLPRPEPKQAVTEKRVNKRRKTAPKAAESKTAEAQDYPTYTLGEVEDFLSSSIVYGDHIYDVCPHEYWEYDALVYAACLKWGEWVVGMTVVMDWLTYHFLSSRGYDPEKPAEGARGRQARRALEEIRAWSAGGLAAIPYQDAIYTVNQDLASAHNASIIAAYDRWDPNMSGVVRDYVTHQFLTLFGHAAPRPARAPRGKTPWEIINWIARRHPIGRGVAMAA